MSKANETLRTRLSSDPCASIPEEAKRKLDEVRRRYGIHVLDTQARPTEARSLILSTGQAAQALPPSKPEAPTLKTVLSSPAELQSSLPLRGAPTRHATGTTSDDRRFFYLIRIAECALALLCEVTADSDVAARRHVNHIPNLLECREISSEEFLSLSRDFS
jgi:hypothetical protein